MKKLVILIYLFLICMNSINSEVNVGYDLEEGIYVDVTPPTNISLQNVNSSTYWGNYYYRDYDLSQSVYWYNMTDDPPYNYSLATHHGDLSGLDNDDHPQYGERTQVETISGGWTFDTQQTTFASTVELQDTITSISAFIFAGVFYPLGDDIETIGALNNRIKALYISGVLTDGTKNISLADIGNITGGGNANCIGVFKGTLILGNLGLKNFCLDDDDNLFLDGYGFLTNDFIKTSSYMHTSSLWQDVYPDSEKLTLYLPIHDFSSSNVYDSSSYANDGVYMGSSPRIESRYGTVLDFDGSSDFMNLSNVVDNFNYTEGSVELWVNPDFLPTAPADLDRVISFWLDTNNNIEIGFHFVNGMMRYKYKAGGTTEFIDIAYSLVPINNWHHLAMTWSKNDNEFKAYVDGEQQGSTLTIDGNFAGQIITAYVSYQDAGDHNYANIQVDELKIYSKPLTADEIRTHYLRALVPNNFIVTDNYRIADTSGNINFQIENGNATFKNDVIIEGTLYGGSPVFLPQYIFTHDNATMILDNVNVWANLTFYQEVAKIKKGIGHTFNDDTNHTFIINEDGIYDIDYNFDVIDTSVSASDIDVAARVILSNGSEIDGSVFETDIIKQNIENELSHSLAAILRKGDIIVFQFTADDVDVEISTHGTFGEHPESATIRIEKTSNI